jgi:hypothetical protein
MSNNPNSHPALAAFTGNDAAPVHAPYAESAGSITGPASHATHDGPQSHHPALAEWLAPNPVSLTNIAG